jgi:hypothetical protein
VEDQPKVVWKVSSRQSVPIRFRENLGMESGEHGCW